MSHHDLDALGPAWVETPALCRSLSISRSTLGRWRRREWARCRCCEAPGGRAARGRPGVGSCEAPLFHGRSPWR